MPAEGRVEEVEIEGGSNDANLDEVEGAEGIKSGGFLAGPRNEQHEERCGPNEEQEIGGIWAGGGGWNKTLIVGADGQSQCLERDGDGKEKPSLARVGGRAAGDEKRAGSSQDDHGEVQGIGEKETSCRGANKFEVEEEKQRQEESGRDGNPRKLAGREQGDLTSNERDKPGGARIGKSVHHSVTMGEKGRVDEF